MSDSFSSFTRIFEQSSLFLILISVGFLLIMVVILLTRRQYSLRLQEERNRHRALESRMRKRLVLLEGVISRFPEPAAYRAKGGAYIWCNEELAQLWGIPQKKIIGSSPEELFPDSADEMRKMEERAFKRKRIMVKERRMTDRDGELRSLEVAVIPVESSARRDAGVLILYKDISHYREQMDVLNDMYVSLREDLQARSGYYADFLKVGLPPLNRIIDESESLLNSAAVQGEGREVLESIVHSGIKINETIRNLSFLAFPDKTAALFGVSSDSGGEQPSLEDWQNQLCARLQAFSEKQKCGCFVLLQGDVPESLETDFLLLNELLERLVENAERYAAGGIHIIIRINRLESGFFTMNIRVRNMGPVIKAGMREEIFKPFSRIAPRAEGNGLGLTVARTLAQKMGGSLSCDPSCPDGARFLLSLPPVKGTGTVISGSRLGGFAAGENNRILIADDDDAFVRKLERQLSKCSYAVESVDNGRDALERLQKSHYFLALVDEMMPYVSGMEILEQWRDGKLSRLKGIKLMNSPYRIEEGDPGLDDIYPFLLPKPLGWERLLDYLIAPRS